MAGKVQCKQSQRGGKTIKCRQKALYLMVFLCFGFTVISLRLVSLMLYRHEHYEALAIENHWTKRKLPARRGAIVDRHGVVLAQTHVLYDVRLDGRYLKDPEGTIRQVATVLELPVEKLLSQYNPKNGYWLLKHEVDDTTVAALKNLKIQDSVRHLIYEPRSKRVYPNGSHASHLLGFLSNSGVGASGVEKLWDQELRGIPGQRWMEKDGRSREIRAYRRKDVAPVDGHEVILTIDLSIQHAVEQELDQVMETHQAKAAYAIVVQPKTGEILALVNRPTFDPNERKSLSVSSLRNRCLTDSIEPGSIFKIVTIAAGINDGLVTPQTPIYCEAGRFFYAGHYLKDHQRYEVLTVDEVMAYSSNIGTAKIALDLGEKRLSHYIHAFGFGEKTGLLSGQAESSGIVHPVDQWSKLEVTRIPIGQGIAVTPLQMAMAMGVIANEGILMRPMLIKQINDSQGRPIQQFEPQVVRHVISPESSRMVGKTLESVFDYGTGKKMRVTGFTGAGKTGTAQKIIQGRYSKEKYVASFLGYVPAQNPEFVALIMVDEPNAGQIYGGQVAGPIFSKLSRQIAQYLGLDPSQEGSQASWQQAVARERKTL